MGAVTSESSQLLLTIKYRFVGMLHFVFGTRDAIATERRASFFAFPEA